MHLPTTARSPIGSSASNTASVSWTVSIVKHGGRAAEQQLAGGQPRGRGERRRRVRRFHRPDALLQPVEQREIVGVAAKERLAEMNVRLDEARQQVVAGRVDDAVRARVADVADRGDPAVAHQHVALDHVERVVHRQNCGVADEK